jgi:hypothetical protein
MNPVDLLRTASGEVKTGARVVVCHDFFKDVRLPLKEVELGDAVKAIGKAGDLRRKTVFTTEKMAVLAPIPKARAAMAANLNPGERRNWRAAWRRSNHTVSLSPREREKRLVIRPTSDIGSPHIWCATVRNSVTKPTTLVCFVPVNGHRQPDAHSIRDAAEVPICRSLNIRRKPQEPGSRRANIRLP